MKDVLRRAVSALGVFAGSTMAFKKMGTKDWISGLLITSPNCFRDLFAAARTCACESVKTPVSRGITIGKDWDSCFGAQYAIIPRSSIEPFFVRHCFSSRPSSREGRIVFKPYPDMLAMMTLAVS